MKEESNRKEHALSDHLPSEEAKLEKVEEQSIRQLEQEYFQSVSAAREFHASVGTDDVGRTISKQIDMY